MTLEYSDVASGEVPRYFRRSLGSYVIRMSRIVELYLLEMKRFE